MFHKKLNIAVVSAFISLLIIIIGSIALFIFYENKHEYHVIEKQIPRSSFKILNRANIIDKHELVFAIQQNNHDLLDTMLIQRSTPGHKLYRKWLSFDELGEIIRNKDSAKTVLDWLIKNDVEVTWISKHQTYIRANSNQ
jgi:cell division protein FtsI/penicillin-binding protein 2